MKDDGTELQKVIPDPISHLVSLSPDGRWIVATIETGEPIHPQIVVSREWRTPASVVPSVRYWRCGN